MTQSNSAATYPSMGQARILASVWGGGTRIHSAEASGSPIVTACVKSGWLIPAGGEENAADAILEVSVEGLRALTRFLERHAAPRT